MTCTAYLYIRDLFYKQTLHLRPELQEQPFWLELNGRVLCHTPELASLGIRPGLPARTARRIAPTAEPVPYLPEHFKQVDELFCSIAYKFTPVVEPFHPGEIFLGLQHNGPSGSDCRSIAVALLAEVRDQGMDAVVAVAGSRLASRLLGRITTLPYAHLPVDGAAAFLRTRPLDCLWTIPRKIRERLGKLGVFKVGDLQRFSRQDLQTRFGQAVGTSLYLAARGVDASPLTPAWPPERIQSEVCFPPIDDSLALVQRLSELSSDLSGKLKQQSKQCRTLVLEVYPEDALIPLERSMRLTPPASGMNRLLLGAKRLLEEMTLTRPPERLRLGAHDLEAAVYVQPDLFTPLQRRGLGPEEFKAYLTLRFGSDTLRYCSEGDIAWRERMLAYF